MPGRRAPESARREQILAAAFAVASRTRLEGLTIRAVAERAGLSPGLVLFHFRSREALLVALLDWLLDGTIVGEPSPEVLALPSAAMRLLAWVRQELELLPGRKPRLELFFDFWVAGKSDRAIKGRIQKALARYRDAILPLADEVVREHAERFPGVRGEDLAALVIAVIEGCVVQAVVDPRGFDVTRILASVAAVVDPAAIATGPARAKRATRTR